MTPRLAEMIKEHPSESLALADPQTLQLQKCNSNFEKLLLQKHYNQAATFYEALGKSVPREKLKAIIESLQSGFFYIDSDTCEDHTYFLSLIKYSDKTCCLIRVVSHTANKALQQYERLFEQNLAGVYKSELGGKLISCNKAFSKILGYEDPKDLIGKNVTSFYAKSSERKKYLQALKKNPVLMNFEVELLRKDGSSSYCLENSYMESTTDGKTFVSGTLIDITEKKQIERELQESEQRFKTISSVSHESVIFCKDDVIIDCNDQFAKMFGYNSRTDSLSRKLTEYFTPQDIKRLKTSLEISGNHRTEIRAFDRNGKTIFLEATGNYLNYQGAHTMAFVFNEVTARKKAEFALEQSVFRFKNLLENSPNAVIILTDGKIKYINHAGCLLLSVDEEDDLYDKTFLSYISAPYKKEIKLDLEDIREGREIEYKEIKIKDINDQEIDVGIKSILTVYDNKPSIQITLNNVSARKQLVQEQIRLRLIEEINTVLKTEIEEHKRTQQKLKQQQRETQEQKARLESILNSTENMMMWTVNKKMQISSQNKNFVHWMKEHAAEEVELGENILTLLERHADPDLYQGQLQSFNNTFKGRPQQFEMPLRNASGQTIWIQIFLNPIYMDHTLDEISCLAYDNTDRKEIDKRVRDSLKEKEVLLQEVHHRVKNNLQVISSILNLQSSYVSDEKTKEILEESQQRIKSMSFIHETLYRTSDFSKLEFTEYLRTITSNLIQSYRSAQTQVQFIPEMDDVYLSLDQSIPCGLIVNELVSNALKYAFTGRKKGNLHLLLTERNEDIHLEIRDDGIGLPKDFGYEKTDSLGIQLVYSLIEQLDATIDIKSTNKGTTFAISFKKK